MILELEIVKCQRCPLSCNVPYGCTPMVGIGNNKSNIVLVLPNPSLDNILIQSPMEYTHRFYIEDFFNKCGIGKNDFFITCLVKCPVEKGTPKVGEIKECSTFLLQEIKDKKVIGSGEFVCKNLKKLNIDHLSIPSVSQLFMASKLKENAVISEIIRFLSK